MQKPERSYSDLIVWQKAVLLTLEAYRITKQFPREERFALVDQMRRAAVSIPSNIAEGRSRGTAKDFSHFLRTALGSAAELETQLIISHKLTYCTAADYEKVSSLLSEVRRMLHAIINKLGTSE
jgi:four helix bundle protein